MGEIMKSRNYKRLSAGILFVFTIGTTACNTGNGEQVYLHDDNTFIENHTSGILDYESISYEEYSGAGVMSMGPHEPLYRGVICLNEQYARDIFEDYEWEETDVDFISSKVDVSGLEGPWYSSEQYSKELAKFTYEPFNYVVFNGKDLVFSLKTD
ncbi:MAG: hypothetical protein K6E88_00465 [Lachnospiraceae bacterium]|nr:hypothetical protein [Lachnospiraceae bacterium]